MTFGLTDYAGMWDATEISEDAIDAAADTAARIIGARSRYQAVATTVGVPWWWIGCIHAREADGDFHCHLHNGDPLTHRTVHVPVGRPPIGNAPFAWEVSATDALIMRHLGPGDWSVPSALGKAEAYNGLGYRAKGIRSPYVWGGTNLQQPGKYVSDHVWDATAVDDQIGVAALMQCLAGLGVDLV
jgi:lysozyme family protein